MNLGCLVTTFFWISLAISTCYGGHYELLRIRLGHFLFLIEMTPGISDFWIHASRSCSADTSWSVSFQNTTTIVRSFIGVVGWWISIERSRNDCLLNETRVAPCKCTSCLHILLKSDFRWKQTGSHRLKRGRSHSTLGSFVGFQSCDFSFSALPSPCANLPASSTSFYARWHTTTHLLHTCTRQSWIGPPRRAQLARVSTRHFIGSLATPYRSFWL